MTKPRWRQMDSGDWAYERGEGEAAQRLGTVVFQDLHGLRTWFSVSALKGHGPDEGGLSECKRRIEALHRTARADDFPSRQNRPKG